MGRRSMVLWLAVSTTDAAAGGARSSITVLAASSPADAMITEYRDLDVTAGGTTSVASTIVYPW